MFTEKAQELIDLAKAYAFVHVKDILDIEALLAAVGKNIEAGVRLAECLANGNVSRIRAKCPDIGQPAPCPGKLDFSESIGEIIVSAADLSSANGVPDRSHPGLIDIRHLVCAIACSGEACRKLGAFAALTREDAVKILTAWYADGHRTVSLTNLVNTLRGLRSELSTRVFGQDHAIHTFIEGICNSEIAKSVDKERKRPAAVFLLAGPPGVGKTYTAELVASYLKRPFKRFDMTGFADHQSQNTLVGFSPSYKDAHSGLLTGFVENNPDAILLFDEIEKTHLKTLQLFFQILDAGNLEDKYTEHNVLFRDTMIIFTTNAGKSLYDNPNRIGINAANAKYHKRTILSALENEKNPADGRPAFPQALCSRLGQGYAVMFNHLSVNDLERVCAAELSRTQTLLEKQYYKDIRYSPLLPICLVFREGRHADARQLRAEAEKFVKEELFKYYSLYSSDKLEEGFNQFDQIVFEVEGGLKCLDEEIRSLFEPPEKARILLVANSTFTRLCKKNITEVHWLSSTSVVEIVDILSTENVDMVLLDIWIRREMGNTKTWSESSRQGIDYTPLSARVLDHGRQILHKIHESFPQTPTYLLSFDRPDSSAGTNQGYNNTFFSETERRPVDEELFLACVRSGGARGLLTTDFVEDYGTNWKKHCKAFNENLLEINRKLYRENKAQHLARERKVLGFDTAAKLRNHNKELIIRICGFRISRAIDAMDAGEMVDDIKRPDTRFSDVLGANEAKKALQFVVDWMKNPKQYAAMGIRPPKGYLLAGPPGTGKTMLARAVAGECDCAFIEKAASSFVTIWQGSGPQNIRELFQRARRYAPSVVFIDEIDAIGILRSSSGSLRAEESSLNALLTEMDGFQTNSSHPVVVLAATNLADQLDKALKRRFDDAIDVDRPDKPTRLRYLDNVIGHRKNSGVTPKAIERLAGQTAGLTIADLERIVHQAAIMAARKEGLVTDGILAEAYDLFRMGAARKTIDQEALCRTARHESGHALISCLCGKPPVRLTIVGRNHALGFMEHESDENKGSFSKKELEQIIRISMAGRAAEIIYYGEEGGLDTGVAGDLKIASHWAFRMVTEFGMCSELGQLSLKDTFFERSTDGPLAIRVTKSAERIVTTQLNTAIEILREKRRYLDKMVEELLEKNTLYKEELERMIRA